MAVTATASDNVPAPPSGADVLSNDPVLDNVVEALDTDTKPALLPSQEDAAESGTPKEDKPKDTEEEVYTLPPYASNPTLHTETHLTLDLPLHIYPTPLNAILSLPTPTSSPHAQVPAIIILGGTGGVDANCTLGPNKTYKDLALGLSTAGIAVLRADKPTVGGKMLKNLPDATIEWEYIDPALAMLRVVMGHERVDKTKVYVLGHSLGGSMASTVFLTAKQTEGLESVRGFIMVAAGGRALHWTVVDQFTELAEGGGEEPKKIFGPLATKCKIEAEYIDSDSLTGKEPAGVDAEEGGLMLNGVGNIG